MTSISYSIRLATVDDFHLLPAVETSAGKAFKEIGYDDIAAMPATLAEGYEKLIERQGFVWVAETIEQEIIAFCAAYPTQDGLYINEISVHSSHAKQRLGSNLLKTALTTARSNGYKSAFLLTFEKVPFNAPFYVRNGFEVIEDLSLFPELQKLANEERETPLWKYGRVAMKLDL